MVALRMVEDPCAVCHGPTLGIGSPVIQPPDSRMGDRTGAHRAGLQRHPQVSAFESLLPQRLRGGAQREHLGMRGRVG